MLVVQASEALLADRLQAIVWAQITMAAVMVICAIAVLAAGLAVWLLARRALRQLEETRDRILPGISPLLGRAGDIADHVGATVADVRAEARDVQALVQDVLERSRQAADALDERVRRFGLVIDAVQEQAEELLLDAASAAHGVHVAARALREEAAHEPRSGETSAAGTKPTKRGSP